MTGGPDDRATAAKAGKDRKAERRANAAERRAASKAAAAAARKAARQAAREERERERARRRERSLTGRIGRTRAAQWTVGALMHLLFESSRLFGRRRASRFGGGWTQLIGPFTGENRIAAANLARAFPEKSETERKAVLKQAWDHLGRTTVEYAFLDELVEAFDPGRPTGGVIEHTGIEHAFALRDRGVPGVIFGAHLGNWELTAAIGAKIGVPVTALYRPPSNPYVAAEMERRRSRFIDKLVVSGRGAALQVASALRSGKHIGAIVDQRIDEGVELPFLGVPAMTNPIVGVLARLFECPVHGAYTIRLPDGRFRIEMTPPLDLPRDARGKVDAEATNRLVHGTIEGWIRRTPEQWLWMHDRWRMRRSRPTSTKVPAKRKQAPKVPEAPG